MNEDQLLEQYKDILHFIEDAVISYYAENRELIDHDVDKVYDIIIRTLQHELRDRPAPKAKLSDLQNSLYEGLMKSARWLLGEGQLEDEAGQPVEVESIPKADLVACFKRLRKSIKLWTADYGRQGYLGFLKPHFPEND